MFCLLWYVFVCPVGVSLTVVLCSTGSTTKRCARENNLPHTRHAATVCVCAWCVCLLNSISVYVWEECAKPDNPGGLVRPCLSPRAKLLWQDSEVNQPPVCAPISQRSWGKSSLRSKNQLDVVIHVRYAIKECLLLDVSFLKPLRSDDQVLYRKQ